MRQQEWVRPLRLLCLWSQLKGGFKEKDYDLIARQLVHAYGAKLMLPLLTRLSFLGIQYCLYSKLFFQMFNCFFKYWQDYSIELDQRITISISPLYPKSSIWWWTKSIQKSLQMIFISSIRILDMLPFLWAVRPLCCVYIELNTLDIGACGTATTHASELGDHWPNVERRRAFVYS